MLNINEDKLKQIKFLAMDFDGIMTDGSVYVDQDGREAAKCSRKDGLGIELLKKAGLAALVVSKESNPVVSARCRKLDIACYQKAGSGEQKLDIIKRAAGELGVALDAVAYMGDDLNDLAVLRAVGLAITVADGHPLVKEICAYVTNARGGEHAVREVCENILLAQGHSLLV